MAEKIAIITDYKPDGTNKFFSIDDLPFSDEAKRMALEWFARKLWVLLEEGSGESDYYCKMYVLRMGNKPNILLRRIE